ncbi:dematin isoform X2 [Festucalex cinctus]
MNKVDGHAANPANLASTRDHSGPSSPATHAVMCGADEQAAAAYRELAALPRDKAILQVERPDLMTYRPHLSFSPLDPPRRQRSLSPPAASPATSPDAKGRRAESDSGSPGGSMLQLHAGRKISASLQHFHRPDNGSNLYMKPPIYKQEGSKDGGGGGGGVIQAAKFPAAQPPDPKQPSKIESDSWPCPPSLAAMEIEWRKKKMEEEDEDDFEDLTDEAKMLQEQELEKIKSNLGRLILREEKEKDGGHFRRKTRSLPDRTHAHAGLAACAYKSPTRSASGLSRRQSAEFSSDGANAAAQVSLCLFVCLCVVARMSRVRPERRAAARPSGPWDFVAQHLGAEGVSLRSAGGEPQGALQAPAWSGPNQTGATFGPGEVPSGFRHERLGV